MEDPARGIKGISAEVRRIVVRAPNWLGDAVLATPALASLHEGFPQASITVAAPPSVADLVRGHPAADAVLPLGPGLRGRVRALRNGGFDLAVILPNSFSSALPFALARIPVRYGARTNGRGWLLTRSVPSPSRGHQARRYLELIRPLCPSVTDPLPRLVVAEEERQAARKILEQGGAAPCQVLVAIHPGASYGTAKRWTPERYARAAVEVASRMGAAVVILGAAGEAREGDAVLKALEGYPSVALTGRLSIRQLMAVLSCCRLLLTNDSGPMHIAGALGVPVAAVFGPTDPEETGPLGRNARIVRKPVFCSPCLLRRCPIDHRCMERVAAEDLAQAARELVGEASRRVVVFLDRDGTINDHDGYLRHPSELKLFPGAAAGIRRLNERGISVVVITNQSGMERGIIPAGAIEEIHRHLRLTLQEEAGAVLDGIYVCPHLPERHCDCRKPGTGLIDVACRDLRVTPEVSYLIGDQRVDLDLAAKIGARPILVLTGAGKKTYDAMDGRPPAHVAAGLGEAVEWLLRDLEARR